MSEGIQSEQENVCDHCGRYGAYDFTGKTLCAECYQASGSCCPGIDSQES